MDKSTFSEKRNHWVLASCPSTQEEVVGSGWYQEFSIPNGQVTWWQCPACHGWHVLRLAHCNRTGHRQSGPGLSGAGLGK